MSKDPENAFYYYLNVFSEYILVTVRLKIMGNATNVATDIFREHNYIKSDTFEVVCFVLAKGRESPWNVLIKKKKKSECNSKNTQQ